MAPQTTPANEWAEARPGTGSEHPDELPATNYLQIERTFCFADLSGFTRYTSEHGPLAAVDRLGEFREVSRDVAAKRGVRVAKWLGDGVMMVGTEPTPTIAWGGHVISHFKEAGVEVRAGLASCDVDYLPDWMQVLEVEEVDIRGVGSVRGIQRLGPRLG